MLWQVVFNFTFSLKVFLLNFDLSSSTLLNDICLLRYKASKHRYCWCVFLGYPAFCTFVRCLLQLTNYSLRTWILIEIIPKPDVKTGVGYQHYLGDRIWKILLMQKPLLRDSRSRSGWKAGLDVQPEALLLVHSISCSSTRGALSPLLWLLTTYSLLLPQNVCALSAGGRMGKNTYSNKSHLFSPLLFISGGGNIIPLLYIIPLL